MSKVEVVHHADNRFYELLVNGQFARLIVYEATGEYRPLMPAGKPAG